LLTICVNNGSVNNGGTMWQWNGMINYSSIPILP